MSSQPEWVHHPLSSHHDQHVEALLSTSLSAAVPLRVLSLYERGGPDVADLEEARAFGQVLAEKGDRLLYGSSKKGETAALFNGLARALAALSFLPGGVPCPLGGPFDARSILSGFVGREVAKAYCQSITERAYGTLPQVWASCYLLHREESPHVANITEVLERLGPQELNQLRAEGYTNQVQTPQGGATTDPLCIATHLLLQLANADRAVAVMIHEVLHNQRPLPVCRVNQGEVEAWRAVRRPSWKR